MNTEEIKTVCPHCGKEIEVADIVTNVNALVHFSKEKVELEKQLEECKAEFEEKSCAIERIKNSIENKHLTKQQIKTSKEIEKLENNLSEVNQLIETTNKYLTETNPSDEREMLEKRKEQLEYEKTYLKHTIMSKQNWLKHNEYGKDLIERNEYLQDKIVFFTNRIQEISEKIKQIEENLKGENIKTEN